MSILPILAARVIIQKLGLDKKGNLLHKINSVYTDKQNVHDSSINKSINEFTIF